MRYWLTIFICCCCNLLPTAGSARGSSNYDSTSPAAVRIISKDQLQQLRKNPAFRYERWKEPPASLLERFWSRILNWFTDWLSTDKGRVSFWTVIVLLSAGILSYFVYRYIGKGPEAASLFERNNTGTKRYRVEEENIHLMDFDKEIGLALQSGNYRLALRLRYLQMLKYLSDKDYIEWQPEKTNQVYVAELGALPDIQNTFRRLTHDFEYAWYGDNIISSGDYEHIVALFGELYQQLKTNKPIPQGV